MKERNLWKALIFECPKGTTPLKSIRPYLEIYFGYLIAYGDSFFKMNRLNCCRFLLRRLLIGLTYLLCFNETQSF